jgi:hypothetical protein
MKRPNIPRATGLAVACLLFGSTVAGAATDARPPPQSQSARPTPKAHKANVQEPPPPLDDPYHAPSPPRRLDDGLERRTVPQPAD